MFNLVDDDFLCTTQVRLVVVVGTPHRTVGAVHSIKNWDNSARLETNSLPKICIPFNKLSLNVKFNLKLLLFLIVNVNLCRYSF